MEVSVIAELINSIGFPAAVCAALFWQNHNVLNQFKKTIDNNTRALNEIIIKLGEPKHGD